jgi:anti-anti-sigma factor
MSAVVLTQGGELDIASIPRLMQRLEPHRQPGSEVVLDLRGVVFMDCYSLGHIIAAHADSATEGWTLRLLV